MSFRRGFKDRATRPWQETRLGVEGGNYLPQRIRTRIVAIKTRFRSRINIVQRQMRR